MQFLYERMDDFIDAISSVPTIVSGGARGADKLGEVYAKDNGYNLRIFPADWNTHGYKAGFLRNEEMAEYADALAAFWDGKSRGTKHMISTALKKAIIRSSYTGMKKLKRKHIQEYRTNQWRRQKGICPLCKRYIRKEQATLDHCHENGHIRMVLHRNCNSIEGRVLHWARRSHVSPDVFLKHLLEYWAGEYTLNPLHPTHGYKRRRRRRRKK